MNASTAAPGRQPSFSIGALDRPWHRHFIALAIGPVTVPTVARLRGLFEGLMVHDPTLPLVCTIGSGGTRWVAVPPQNRAAHLERMVSAGDDPSYDDVAGHIERYRPPLDSDLPLTVVVGPQSIVLYSPHLLGDGYTFSRMALKIAQADAAGLADLRNRASFRDALGVLVKEASTHWRDWTRRVIGHGRSVGGARPTGSAGAGEHPADAVPFAGTADPRSVAAVLSNAQVRGIVRWRNQHCPGVSITAVLASVIYRSLVEQGISMNGTGLNTILDLRRYLPADRQSLPGNLAQSVYLQADLSDPAAIDSALDGAIASARPVPGLVLRAAAAKMCPPRHTVVGTPGPISMSLSLMPALPGLAGLPWLAETGRRYVGYAYPAGVRGISIFAVRLRDRMELVASFDARAVDPAAVRAALENVGGAGRLLAVAR